MNRRIAASLASLLIAAACLTGCSSDKDKVKVTVNTGSPAAVEEVKDLGPGEEFSGSLGQEFDYEKSSLKVSLDEVGQTSPVTADGTRDYVFLFTAVNNSDKPVDMWMLDAIQLSIDGVELPFSDTFSAISAANAAMQYSEYQKFDGTIEPGESLTGYIPFEIKGDWMKMKLEYKPDTVHSNDYIVYDIAFEDVVKRYE